MGRLGAPPVTAMLKSLSTEKDWLVVAALKTALMLTCDPKVREAVARENEQRPSPALGQILAFRAGPAAGDVSKADAVVARSLEWLAAHQEADGSWRAEKTNPYHNKKIFARFDPNVDERFAVSVTSFALLAFQGAGYNHKSGPYADSIARGFEWLVSQQKEDGRIDAHHKEDKFGLHLVATSFNHLLAVLALCEGYIGTGDESLKASAQKALNYIRPHPAAGREYFFDTGRIDISTTALLAMTAACASTAGLEYDAMNVGATLMFLMKMTDPATGMVLHSLAMARAGQKYCFGGYGSAAIGLMCAAYADPRAEKIAPGAGTGVKVLAMQKALVGAHLPAWNTRYAIAGEGFAPLAPTGTPERQLVKISVEDIINYDYWFFAVLGLFLSGDDAPDADWRRWHEGLAKVLTEHQEMYGDTRGSFEPECPWSRVAGRVYSTAISALAMQVPQQRLSIFKRKR
jgi:hypothetical protein